ncbi:MAG UNVERIFIED_CONTAM: hypothetical protein LVT10_11825 [Anaerolineae bacterium]
MPSYNYASTSNAHYVESTVVSGELVEQADYEAWQLTLESSKTGNP